METNESAGVQRTKNCKAAPVRSTDQWKEDVLKVCDARHVKLPVMRPQYRGYSCDELLSKLGEDTKVRCAHLGFGRRTSSWSMKINCCQNDTGVQHDISPRQNKLNYLHHGILSCGSRTVKSDHGISNSIGGFLTRVLRLRIVKAWACQAAGGRHPMTTAGMLEHRKQYVHPDCQY